MVPVSDGTKVLELSVNIDKAIETEGAEVVSRFERAITLMIIDQEWKEHLREMDDLRTNVQNASMEQKDPLLIYKFESFELFKIMLERVNGLIAGFLMKGEVYQNDQGQTQVPAPKIQIAPPPKPPVIEGNANRGESASRQGKSSPAVAEQKVGRNDPCPCGSGKKFKACHGANS